MKIAVLSYAWGDHTKISDITFPLWEAYCKRHGYTFVHDWPAPAEDADWQKPRMILEHLNKFDLLLWADADTLPMADRSIELVWRENGDQEPIVIAADCYGLNAGVMILSACPVVEMFFRAVLEIGYPLYKGNPWDEQEAIIRFAHQHPFKDHVRVVPQRVLNSYVNSEYKRPALWAGNYEPGDWIIHFPGLPLDRRLELVKEYAAMIPASPAPEPQPQPDTVEHP